MTNPTLVEEAVERAIGLIKRDYVELRPTEDRKALTYRLPDDLEDVVKGLEAALASLPTDDDDTVERV